MKDDVWLRDGRWSNADRDGICITSSDPSWPARFAEEAAALWKVLPTGTVADIIHVGSTAVSGLVAKPVIDMLLFPGPSYQGAVVVNVLEEQGYVYWRENPRRDRIFCVKGMPPHGLRRTHHIHVRPMREAREMVRFRDELRANPEAAEEYGALKQALAARFHEDREAYTKAKSDFVRRVLRAAEIGSRDDR